MILKTFRYARIPFIAIILPVAQLELPPLPVDQVVAPRALTWRSLLLGLAGVIAICAVTPYNDYALDNTMLVGNNLPLGVVMLLFISAVMVNGPLSKWKPAWALSGGEITVAFMMTLVGCGLPSSGLMRYFPPALVSPWYQARSNTQFANIADSLGLPKWLFPNFSGNKPSAWANDPIVGGYIMRWTGPSAPPYLAWVQPALIWSIFIFALYGAMLCITSIVRKQWYENERLQFPLASIYLSLIEPPEPKRYFNSILSRRSFWIGFFCVLAVHLWNGASAYWPNYFPAIPLHYDLWSLFENRPWTFMDTKMKDDQIYFTVVGVTFFLSNSVGFSLWAFYVFRNICQMWLGMSTGDGEIHGRMDQHLGAVLAFGLMIVWVGRRHWMMVIRQAFTGAREGESGGRYLNYPLAFWGLVACLVIMVGFLVAAGAEVFPAMVMVAVILTGFIVLTRIIAETGLVHGQVLIGVNRPWTMSAAQAAHKPFQPIGEKSFFMGSILQAVFYDMREPMPVYTTHAVKVSDQTIFANRDTSSDRRSARSLGRRLFAMMFLAMIVGYFVSFASTLWTEYHYAWSKDVIPKMPINDWGASGNPRAQIVDPTVTYHRGNYYPQDRILLNLIFGFAVTIALSMLRLRFAGWPLHPVGFLMMYTYPGAHLWFSIFLGWLCRTVVVRLGGARLYTDAKPLFLGLIVGESMAAAFWMLAGIVLSSAGIPYKPIHITLP